MTDKSRMLRYYYKYNSNGEFVILHNNLVLQEIPKKILVDQSYSNFIEVFIEIINENSFIIKEKAEINVIYINPQAINAADEHNRIIFENLFLKNKEGYSNNDYTVIAKSVIDCLIKYNGEFKQELNLLLEKFPLEQLNIPTGTKIISTSEITIKE